MNKRSIAIILCGLVFFTAAGLWLERAEPLRPAKKTLRTKSVPTAVLEYGVLGRVFDELGLTRAVENDHSVFQPTESTPPDDPQNDTRSKFQKKRHIGQILLTANTGGPSAMPAALAVSNADFKEGWPVLSVVVNEDDLHSDEKGIMKNHARRGREWERLANTAYFEDGKLLFATTAGIRKHGGSSRALMEQAHFRLYFRDEYGANQFKPGLLFPDQSHPTKRLVVYNHDKAPFINCLAYDIANRIGSIAPRTKPAVFYLNGVRQGRYFLCEHLSSKQYSQRIGHEDFDFYRFKSTSDELSKKNFGQLRQWAWDRRNKMTMEEANKRIDLDNLSRHLIATMFCGTTDGLQGIAARDRKDPRARWFWIHWDMDHSFRDIYRAKMARAKKTDPRRKSYEQEDIELALDRRGTRSVIFVRLLNESPAFRQYFVRLFVDLLNHRIDPEFLTERMDYYENLTRSYGADLAIMDYIRKYLDNKPRVIRERLPKYFGGLGSPVKCSLQSTDEIQYLIDNYPQAGSYEGHYYAGMTITVEIQQPHAENFSHWLINDQTQSRETRLTTKLQADTIIEPVFNKP